MTIKLRQVEAESAAPGYGIYEIVEVDEKGNVIERLGYVVISFPDGAVVHHSDNLDGAVAWINDHKKVEFAGKEPKPAEGDDNSSTPAAQPPHPRARP